MQRRAFLWTGPAFLATSARAGEPGIPAIAEYETRSFGHIGLYAENIRTGAKLSWRARESFVMCSTFKASLAACVLARVDHGQDRLDQRIAYGAADMRDWHAPVAQANLAKGWLSIEDMCQAIVEQSDNSCANLLLSHIGGPGALTAFWRRMGDQTSRLDDTEPVLNRTPPGGSRNTTTPAAMARTLRDLVLGDLLSAPSRSRLTTWLIGCQTGANRLRAGLPKTWVIADKTGNNGSDAAGDIAIVWPKPDTPIVICAFTRGGAPSPAQLETVFSGMARLIGTRLV